MVLKCCGCVRQRPNETSTHHEKEALQGISGMGSKKLQAYGEEVLRICQAG